MNQDQSRSILENIERSSHQDLSAEVVALAVAYARIRVDWLLAERSVRRDLEDKRTRAHDAFIDSLNILSRAESRSGGDIGWREQLGTDRKRIGDFACQVHALLGLRAG